MKAILITLLVISMFLFSSCTPESGKQILDDPQAECGRVEGVWETFSSTCIDSCEYARAPGLTLCGMALTDGCDCGPDQCWNGQTCEQN